MDIQKAQQFVLKNARPIERAEFGYYFQNGSRQAVIEALSYYQNPDGGFGHGLEPDNWNPASHPIAANMALEILFRTGALEDAKEMTTGLVHWLKASVNPKGGYWPAVIDSNKEHPHAIWWEVREGLSFWNPTVSLAAFLVCMGEREYREVVQSAFKVLEKEQKGDGLNCYILAYRLLKQSGIKDVIDLNSVRRSLEKKVEELVCTDSSKYGVEYVPAPSYFDSDFLPETLLGLIEEELASLDRQQMEDGGFEICWKWSTPYPEEARQARDWSRPRVTMEKLLFYQRWKAKVSKT